MRAIIVHAEVTTANNMRITFCQDREGYYATARKLDSNKSWNASGTNNPEKRFATLFEANKFFNSLPLAQAIEA